LLPLRKPFGGLLLARIRGMARGSDQPCCPPSADMPVKRAATTGAGRPDAATTAKSRISRTRIDGVFSRATRSQAVPGIVAIAADKRDILYDGAFGKRSLGEAESMTLDTVFMLASMTKTVTSVAAMQLVEEGVLALDAPLGHLISHLKSPGVLTGFAGDGSPVLRPARRPVTLRHLLTHTSGFGHELWSPGLVRYQQAAGIPQVGSQKRSALDVPLLFDPGERWEYSIGIEWVGLVIEAATGVTLGRYLRDRILAPLGMHDTTFGIVPRHRGRLAAVHQRESDGTLRPIEWSIVPGEYEAGGGGLYGTALDYITFLRMLLNGGEWGGERFLRSETIELMWRNHIGDLEVTRMVTLDPITSNSFEVYPGLRKRWGLGAMITLDAGPDGRSAGSQAWGGIANCYFWLDPVKEIAGLLLTQILPFGDPTALDLMGAFERGVYGLPE
jgi:methyl acetate hydrolase